MQMWTFSPLAENAYTLEPTLTYWPVQSHGSIKSHLTLVVEGVGSRGWIEVELFMCLSDFNMYTCLFLFFVSQS